jgi:hypothetical protein
VRNSYLENESEQQTLKRAFRNIAGCLELWSHTDVKKLTRVQELDRAQELILIMLTSIRASEDNPFNVAFTRILSKTSSDITDALTGKKVNFSDHVQSFKWMAENMN